MSIVGIRYIGKKDECEDTVTKTGAVWTKDQVHNFSQKIADKLLVHTDSFELTDISQDGDTFLSEGGLNVEREPVAYININSMGIDELVLYAKREFNRTVQPEGKSVEVIRGEVHTLMNMSNLDQLALEKAQATGKEPHLIMVTPEEKAAIESGEAVVRLVPTEVATVMSDAPKEDGNPTLKELVESLDRDDLFALAEQEGIEVSRRLGTDAVRAKIIKSVNDDRD